MNTETIRNSLETEGYFVGLFQNEIFVGKYKETDLESGLITYEPYCRVMEDGEWILAVYYKDSPSWANRERRKTELEMVELIKKEFPL